ncbi:MAG: hypothetical protein KatS3mg004_0165 [Bryobacteraceae bacterium]|nr:MAG: hypothetical protein KatS3mg004_0165 [Bryobacteraceae bacterium]
MSRGGRSSGLTWGSIKQRRDRASDDFPLPCGPTKSKCGFGMPGKRVDNKKATTSTLCSSLIPEGQIGSNSSRRLASTSSSGSGSASMPSARRKGKGDSGVMRTPDASMTATPSGRSRSTTMRSPRLRSKPGPLRTAPTRRGTSCGGASEALTARRPRAASISCFDGRRPYLCRKSAASKFRARWPRRSIASLPETTYWSPSLDLTTVHRCSRPSNQVDSSVAFARGRVVYLVDIDLLSAPFILAPFLFRPQRPPTDALQCCPKVPACASRLGTHRFSICVPQRFCRQAALYSSRAARSLWDSEAEISSFNPAALSVTPAGFAVLSSTVWVELRFSPAGIRTGDPSPETA